MQSKLTIYFNNPSQSEQTGAEGAGDEYDQDQAQFLAIYHFYDSKT